MKINRFVFPVIASLLIAAAVFAAPGSAAAAQPAVQMTPAMDPMSQPTAMAPTPMPGGMMAGTASGQANCPMMSGQMGAMSEMPMSGMMGMNGTSGMPMSGMSGMSGMTGMGMNGMQGINDGLTRGSLFTLNPWWILGWLVLLGLAASLVGIAIFLILREVRRTRQPQAG